MTNQLQAMPEKSDVRKQIEAGLEALEVLQWADDHDLANAQWNAATAAFNIKKLLAEHDRAIESLRVELEAAKSLAQPEQEPVAWHTEDHLTDRSATTYSKDMVYRWECKGWPVTPLYTSPPHRQPLTDEEIDDIWARCSEPPQDSIDMHEFAKAIEAKHGIGDKT